MSHPSSEKQRDGGVSDIQRIESAPLRIPGACFWAGHNCQRWKQKLSNSSWYGWSKWWIWSKGYTVRMALNISAIAIA
ncbi:MAG: hypothetical protein N2235_03180 [Fischerella sp.]|nr:hypothetical protein [Fischerella sp.]